MESGSKPTSPFTVVTKLGGWDALKGEDAPPRDPGASTQLFPERIGRYLIVAPLGSGCFGSVYRAQDEQLRRQVAIKIPNLQRIRGPQDVRLYLTEAQTAAKLDHPNIVPVYDVGQTETISCYIVSKLIDGCDLNELKRDPQFSFRQATELIRSIAEALHYAHSRGIVHRDVKPSNILVDRSHVPYLTDFGLALREEEIGHGARFVGTIHYMSPEQSRGEGHRVDGRSDTFSLGVVLYELLAGRRPFSGDSMAELIREISEADPPPIRQFNPAVPRELERICQRSMARLASERYQTAKDLAEDLQSLLASVPSSSTNPASAPEKRPVSEPEVTPGSASGSGTGSKRTAGVKPESASGSGTWNIVPKGLRAFDRNDADFFLHLLPGARDRYGIPDSVRFWKANLEARNSGEAFPVGILIGPSGCGKSSLMKAGILPRIDEHVVPLLIDAHVTDTAKKLRVLVERWLHSPEQNLSLSELFARLRRGQGQIPGVKHLLIIDQFEQCLYGKSASDNEELVQALRQCDGGNLQCVLMVRDDFWMATSRFMRRLELPVAEGHNCMAVDLFPLKHAERVLAAFGRANGDLPNDPAEITAEQQQFIEAAVRTLADGNKVVSVRLAVFAEMMKGREWTSRALADFGGREGIGVRFLEEQFEGTAAPARHRAHQAGARQVLSRLLPVHGAGIRGRSCTQDELAAAAGYSPDSDECRELFDILDSELRLISPSHEVGPHWGPEPKAPVSANRLHYHLTHDFLVAPLRTWLTKRQRETRRGRAQLALADRAALWAKRREIRQLPSFSEWLRIRCLTRSTDWNTSETAMMRFATRVHLLQLAAAAVVIGAALAWLMQNRKSQQHRLALQFVDQVRNAKPAALIGVLSNMRVPREDVFPLLRQAQLGEPPLGQQLNFCLALLKDPHGREKQFQNLGKLIRHLEINQIAELMAEFMQYPDSRQLLEVLWEDSEVDGMNEKILPIASILCMYAPNDKRWERLQGQVALQLVRDPLIVGKWVQLLTWDKGRHIVPELRKILLSESDSATDQFHRLAAAQILCHLSEDAQQLLPLLKQLKPNSAEANIISQKILLLEQSPLSENAPPAVL